MPGREACQLDEVPGIAKGFRVLTNFFGGKRKNMTLGFPTDMSKVELSESTTPLAGRLLSTAPDKARNSERIGATHQRTLTITSGIEGSWMNTPTQWSENYFRLLLDYEYELVRSPAGAQQWQPIDQKPEDMAPATAQM